MENKSVIYNDPDLRIALGKLVFNVLYISRESPVPGWSYPSHAHSSYELHLIPRGKGTLLLKDRKYSITPGTMYLTGPGIVHEQRADDLEPMLEYCINFEIKSYKNKVAKNSFFSEDEQQAILKTLRENPFFIGEDSFHTAGVFEALFRELDERMIGSLAYMQSLAMLLILNTVRSLSGLRKASYPIPQKIPNDSRRTVVDNYFRDFTKPLSPPELAATIGTSVRQLHRIIRSYYGQSFQERLSQLRLDYAAGLLRSTGRPTAEIAEAAGFSGYSFFCRLFRKQFGVSPAAYRKSEGL